MLLKLKLDTKQMDLNGKHEGIVIDTQAESDGNNIVVDGPEAIAEQTLALNEIAAAKEAEVI